VNEKKATIREQIQAIMEEDIPVAKQDLDTKKWPDEVIARQKKLGELRSNKIGALQAQSTIDAFNDRLAEVAPDDNVCINDVKVYSVTPISHNGVEIYLSPNGDVPEYRIFNPPYLTRDPLGDVEVRGRKYREDPLAAMISIIKSHGKGKK